MWGLLHRAKHNFTAGPGSRSQAEPASGEGALHFHIHTKQVPDHSRWLDYTFPATEALEGYVSAAPRYPVPKQNAIKPRAGIFLPPVRGSPIALRRVSLANGGSLGDAGSVIAECVIILCALFCAAWPGEGGEASSLLFFRELASRVPPAQDCRGLLAAGERARSRHLGLF